MSHTYHYAKHHTITVTSPADASASPTTDVHTVKVAGLERCSQVVVDAVLQGAAGGTLDVYLQRLVYRNPTTGAEVWADWCHFAQIGAAAAAACYHVPDARLPGIFTVGHGTATDATPALAAGNCVGSHPGTELRIAFVAGAGTAAGASQVFYVTCLE